MARFIDQYGQPISSEALDEQQTSKLVGLHREVARHPVRGLTPAKLNAILERAEVGDLLAQHELFRDMEERDGHVFAELSKRKRAVIKLPWDILPPRNPSPEEETATAYVKDLLSDMPDLEDLMFDALDAIAHGFAMIEYDWQRAGSDWIISCASHRPQTWFVFDRDTRTQIHLRDGTFDGSPLRPFGWMTHVHKAMSGYTLRSGLGRVLVIPYLFKHFSVGDLAEFLDIYGLPLRIGKYPSNASDAEKATLWKAVAGIGHNAAGVIPASMQVDFQEAAKGSDAPFQAMIKWCEDTQSKAILGSTLTSTTDATGLGSGVAQIHNEVRMDIRDSDCKQLAGTLTRDLIYPLLALNKGWSDFRRCPRFVFDVTESEDIKAYADALPKLVGVGMEIPVQWAHERLRIPLPSGKDEKILTASSPPSVVPEAPVADEKAAAKADKAALAALASEAGAPLPEMDLGDMQALVNAVDLLKPADLDGQMRDLMQPFVDAIMQADSLEAAEAALATALEAQNPATLAKALHTAGFAAHWLGRSRL